MWTYSRRCGSANVEGVVVGQSWQQLIYCKYFMTLGLNTGKESGSLTTMVGTGGEHIARCVRKMQKEGV
jgi:hypothetical protein